MMNYKLCINATLKKKIHSQVFVNKKPTLYLPIYLVFGWTWSG